MHCETSYDSGANQVLVSDLGSSIAFEEIGQNDKVVINTSNSHYQFSISDPRTHRGMLSGGAIGDEPREAVLIESISKNGDGGVRDFRGLRTGARALFYLPSSRGIERVTTSKISGLALVKAADRKSLIS